MVYYIIYNVKRKLHKISSKKKIVIKVKKGHTVYKIYSVKRHLISKIRYYEIFFICYKTLVYAALHGLEKILRNIYSPKPAPKPA